MLHMTHDIWHMTHRGWWILCPNFRSKALTFWEQWCFEDFEEKDHWLNEWITKECVLCISGTTNYRFELYICAKLFLFCSRSCCLCFMETIWRMLAKGSLFSFLTVTCNSSMHSQKCVTLLKLRTGLTINFFLLWFIFSDNFFWRSLNCHKS